ncbi:extracellular solute-binding protein [Microbacterium sp. B19]|uniref:extracellular solute-binding protein n=1 Tax=Microbacterium sp. B19 TaxID=96765 RepID=UPI0003462EB8|nr:extracellular solute-binding protein [Microbacterium sp. B19]
MTRFGYTRTTRKSRLAAVGATVLAATLILSGCGRPSDAGASASTTTVDDSPATGAVTLWAPDGDATALSDVLADYKKANPDLDLQITLVPSDEYNTKLQTAMAAGTGPDIAQVYTEAQSQFLASGAFAPVPDGLVDASSFFSGVWDAGQYNGTTYSVPWYAYTYALIYRKDLAAAGGATVPTTWDQTLPFFQALEKGGATKGFGADVGWDTYTGQALQRYAVQAGQSLLSADGKSWQIDTPEGIQAISHFTEPYLSGVAAVDTPGFLDSQPYFVDGKTGSMLSGPWVIAALDGVAKQPGWTAEHVATAVQPAGPAGDIGNLGGGSWVVNKDSKNAASAWKVVREMADEKTQIAQFAAYGSMPAVQSAWKDDSIAGNALYDAFFEQLKNVQPMPSATTWTQVSTAIGAELEAVARGTETAEEAAKKLQSAADGIGTGD